MDFAHYDVVVVGAGPAGLSAARTCARLGFHTVVLERLATPEAITHSRSATVAPIPGFVSGVHREDGALHFPALDLLIPAHLILSRPLTQRFLSPGGCEFSVTYADRDDYPLAVIDKPGMVELLAQQAAAAGARLQYGRPVARLMREKGRICGVQTESGQQVGADIVLCAEGVDRSLATQAGLFAPASVPERVATVLHAEVTAPAAGTDAVGHWVTLGGSYTSAAHLYGSIVVPVAGRATVQLTVFEEAAPEGPSDPPWLYLEEYLTRDPRVRSILGRTRETCRTSTRIALREAPAQVVRDGFMGLGDAVTAGGHLGILPSIYMGRQAALVAAEALDEGNTSAECLVAYQSLFQKPFLSGAEAQSHVMENLASMRDEDLERFCQIMGQMQMGTPFFGNWRFVAWESLGWLVRQYPALTREWDVLEQALGPLEDPYGTENSISLPFITSKPISWL